MELNVAMRTTIACACGFCRRGSYKLLHIFKLFGCSRISDISRNFVLCHDTHAGEIKKYSLNTILLTTACDVT